MQDIPIAVMDGLTGFAEAVRAVYPSTELCIVHVVGSSPELVPYKDRRTVAAGPRTIYRGGSGGVPRRVGRQAPHDRSKPGEPLDRDRPVSGLRSGDSKADLHDERDRVAELQHP